MFSGTVFESIGRDIEEDTGNTKNELHKHVDGCLNKVSSKMEEKARLHWRERHKWTGSLLSEL